MRTTALVFTLLLSVSTVAVGQVANQPPVFVDQGPDWSAGKRSAFYTQDQGSKLIPYRWLLELKQPNGQPFLADSLSRYGYLPNPEVKTGLPVGFTASGPVGNRTVGMTCSACRTREITAGGKRY